MNRIDRYVETFKKIVEDKKHRIRVFPVDKLISDNETENTSLQKDVCFIYNRFTGKHENSIPVLSEYELNLTT